MQTPEFPEGESCRVAAVHALGLVGLDANSRFDAILRVAQRVLGVPMAAVSLIDTERQWFAGMKGLPTRETSRDASFCGHAILTPSALFSVSDTHADIRFADNPLVTGAPHIRFYAGVPVLSSSNQALGTLCVLDSVPRILSSDEQELLEDLAQLVQGKLRALEAGTLEFEVQQRRAAELKTLQQERRLAELYAVASSPRHDTASVFRDALELGRRELSLEMGMLTRIEGDTYVVEVVLPPNEGFPVGARMSLAQSYCDLAVRASAPVVSRETTEDERFAPYKGFDVGIYEAYAGIPVEVEGQLYGTLVFWQVAPREEPFSQADIDFLALMSRLMESLLERRQLIARLTRAREAAEKAASAKNTFLATVSHELRTPMNAVLGMNRLVLGTPLESSQRELITDATTAATHLLKLLDDVLDFSRHEANEVTLEVVPFNVDQMIHDSLRSVSSAAHRSGVELTIEVDSTVPTTLIGDPDRLSQVVRNLVGNALKFTQYGLVRVHFGGAPIGAEGVFLARITVDDTGVGIAPEHLDRIFLPFTQRDGSSSRRYGGTGLGLAIVERLVTAMSGSVDVTSTVGVGSSFSASVMLKTSASVNKVRGHRAVGFSRALLVDGHPDALRVLGTLLHEYGVSCRAVATLDEARTELRGASARGEPFEAVFVDEHLGDGEAWAFCEEIQDRALQIAVLASSEDRVALEQRISVLESAHSLWKPVTRAAVDAYFFPRSGYQERTERVQRRASGLAYRVLVAEDNPLNRKLVSLLLQREGLEVDVVSSGRAAVSAVADATYDVVLMDIQMPDMDGLEASRAIRQAELNTGRRTPIIAVTASALAGDRERFLNEGLDGYVAKPIDPALLVAVLNQAFGGLSER